MVVGTLRLVTRLAFVTSLVPGCGTEQSNSARTGTTGSGGATSDAGSSRDAGNANDTGTESACSFTPCGGDLAGSWTIQHVCPASVAVRDCPTVELKPKNVVVTGSFSFGSDGGLTFDILTSGSWEGLVPASCVAGTDCESIAQSLNQINAPPASCASDGDGGCTCSSPATPEQMGTAPYRVTGNVAANMLYCVQDGVLKLRNEAGTVFVASK